MATLQTSAAGFLGLCRHSELCSQVGFVAVPVSVLQLFHGAEPLQETAKLLLLHLGKMSPSPCRRNETQMGGTKPNFLLIFHLEQPFASLPKGAGGLKFRV